MIMDSWASKVHSNSIVSYLFHSNNNVKRLPVLPCMSDVIHLFLELSKFKQPANDKRCNYAYKIMLILSASSILPCIAEIIHLFSLSYQLCICIFWIFAMLPFKLLDHICHGFLYFCKLYYNIGWYNKENYIILRCKIPAANSLAQKKHRVLPPPKSRSNEDYPSGSVDGVWDASSHCGGFGWIIKVPDNTTVFKGSRQIVCGLSPHRWSNRSKASSQSGGSHGAFKSQPIFGFPRNRVWFERDRGFPLWHLEPCLSLQSSILFSCFSY